ncbi:exported protein [Candidatus Burkholderia humilis]|nr:exported protein [Candidatus Burkholderia humilis]
MSLVSRFNIGNFVRACVIALALPFAALPLAQAQTMPPGAKQPSDFPRVKLTAGMYVIDAAVAANDADREQGLMYRTKLAPNEGMLFVFGENAVHCFWMKNTLIPLSIAFIRADGTVTDIDEMQAETENKNNHCPRNNGVYALEMPKGWFAAKGIKPGTQIKEGLPRAQ